MFEVKYLIYRFWIMVKNSISRVILLFLENCPIIENHPSISQGTVIKHLIGLICKINESLVWLVIIIKCFIG